MRAKYTRVNGALVRRVRLFSVRQAHDAQKLDAPHRHGRRDAGFLDARERRSRSIRSRSKRRTVFDASAPRYGSRISLISMVITL